VKDLEVELETTREKSRENLEQALFVERERMTQIQWEMEEIRHKSIEMELKLNSQKSQVGDDDDDRHKEEDDDGLREKLDSVTEKYENLSKLHRDQEARLKADIRVLVKEVKSLRSSQSHLNQQVSRLVEEKSEAEDRLHKEMKIHQEKLSSWMILTSKCKALHEQLQECDVDLRSSVDPSDLIQKSDYRISDILSEARLLCDSGRDGEEEEESMMREVVTSILVDNGVLRKKVNSLMMTVNSVEMDEISSLVKA
ncbi:hypothetical protein M569_00650, partial [Genlisea aurea]